MLCQWLEFEAGGELLTVSKLHSKTIEFTGKSEVYSEEVETKATRTLQGFCISF